MLVLLILVIFHCLVIACRSALMVSSAFGQLTHKALMNPCDLSASRCLIHRPSLVGNDVHRTNRRLVYIAQHSAPEAVVKVNVVPATGMNAQLL